MTDYYNSILLKICVVYEYTESKNYSALINDRSRNVHVPKTEHCHAQFLKLNLTKYSYCILSIHTIKELKCLHKRQITKYTRTENRAPLKVFLENDDRKRNIFISTESKLYWPWQKLVSYM